MSYPSGSKYVTIACVLAGLAFLPASSNATAISWSGAGGNWNVSTDWSPQQVPTSADTATINNGSTVTIGSGVSATAGTLTVGSGTNGTLDILSGANLNVTGVVNVGVGGANVGTITQSGTATYGTGLIMGQFTSGRQGYYYMDGGSLAVNGNGISVARQGSGFFYQTAGSVTAASLSLYATSASAGSTVGLYQISGGVLTVTGDIQNATGAADTNFLTNSTLSIIGSAATINVGGNFAQRSDPKAVLSYAIDNGGASKVNLTGSGTVTLGGTLSAGFEGGLALTTSTTFTLAEANTGHITGSFSSNPNSALWNTPVVQASSGTRDDLVITLNSSAQLGSITFTGSNALAFSATSSGYVAISGLSLSEPITLYLAANAGTGMTTAQLISYFDSNGINAQSSNISGYSVEINYTAAAATSDFDWDLSSFNTTANIAGILAVPEPGITSFLIPVLALIIPFRRRIFVNR